MTTRTEVFLVWSVVAALCACGGSSGSNGSSATGGGGASSTGAGPGTTGTTSGAGTTGGTTGGSDLSCPTGATWIGDTCAVSTCLPQYTGAGCILADGGIGECLGTMCLDVTGDPLHCGIPETACAVGMACDAGSCVGSTGCAGDGGCPAGELCQADGRRCLPSACDATSGQRLCNGGFCCGDVCGQLDGGTDCGACGVTCGDAGFCYADPITGAPKCGDCSSVPTGTACNGGICCGGDCIDQTTDGTNCGGCGRLCAVDAGGSCNNGFCSSSCGGCGCAGCPSGETCFEGFDVAYCISNTCTSGHDGSPCGEFGACCGSTCLAGGFGGDPKNCGACGNACADGDLCRSGVCVQTLGCLGQSSETECLMDGGQGTCCDGQCVDTNSDSANCNECGNACAVGTSCQSGSCPTPFCTQANCPAGTVCAEGECVAGCAGREDGDYCGDASDGGSPYLGFCCGGACSQLGDPQSCGGCGLVCPAGASCFAGGCQLFPSFTPFVCDGVGEPTCANGYGCFPNGSPYGDACAPQDCTSRSNGDPCAYGPETAGECCAGSCALVTSDPANCGACGLSCPSGICSQEYVPSFQFGVQVLLPVGVCQPAPPNVTCTSDCVAGFTCVNGSCVDSLCTGVACIQEDDAVGACCGDGACVDVLTDSANCGGCGLACPQGDACVSAQCQGDVCSLGNSGAYCEQNDATHACCGNACVDTSADPANCGRCGVECPVGATCSGGSCG